MVDPVPIPGGGAPIISLVPPPTIVPSNVPFPSPIAPPNWNTVPNYNAPVMDPVTGTTGIPWNNLLVFLSARASFIQQLNSDVIQLQQQVTTIQGQIATLQSQVATLQSQVATLQAQIVTLQAQVATLQSQVATLETEVAHLLTKTNTAASVTGTDRTVTTAPAMMGAGVTFTPTVNIRVYIMFGSNVKMTTGGATSTINLRFGTGAPPSPGDPVTGTQVTASTIIDINEFTDITLFGLLGPLVLGTTYWLDIAVEVLSGGDLVMNNNALTVVGLIDPN